MFTIVYLRVTIFAVLTLIFLQIGPNTCMQNFVPTNISYMHYRALELIDPVLFSCTSRKI